MIKYETPLPPLPLAGEEEGVRVEGRCGSPGHCIGAPPSAFKQLRDDRQVLTAKFLLS